MAADSKPNILIIMSDEHNPRMSSPYGHPAVQSPAMQRLADGGAVFENAYCNFPLCVPSRASFMTGRYASSVGVWDNTSELPTGEPTWPHRLNALGYETTMAGRMHFIGPDVHHGFARKLVGDHQVGRWEPLIAWAPDPKRGGDQLSPRVPFIKAAGPGDSDYQRYDESVTVAATEYLSEPERRERPWALAVGYLMPHLPFTVREPYFSRYFPEHADLPEIPAGHLDRLHPFNQRLRRFMGLLDGVPDDDVARARAAYYGMVDFCDANVGRVVEALDENGLTDNTFTVYLSDHGEMAGEHGMWNKSCFFDDSTRVPIIVSWPGRVAPGRRIGQVTSIIDLVRTVLDIAGDDADDLDGTSLAGVLDGSDTESDGQAIAEFTAHGNDIPGRMIRRGRYKLNAYLDEAFELYDLESDPGEFEDLAGDPAYADVVAELSQAALRDWDLQEIDRRVRDAQARKAILLRGDVDPKSTWVRD